MSSQSAGGTYDAVTNTIMFRDQSTLLTRYKVNAEIFHAYQQGRTMKLDDIQTSKGYLGGPNVEFEEKFMNIVASAVGGEPLPMVDPDGAQGLYTWVLQLMANHGGNFPTSFSTSEQQQYETFLRGFRQYHVNNNGPASYRGTIDESPNMLVPTNVFDILSKSNC